METCTDTVGALGSADTRRTTRRTVISQAICGLWAVIAAVLGAPAFTYLLGAPKTGGRDEWIDIGDVASVPTGRPVEMVFRRDRTDSWKVVSEKAAAWVVKTPKSGVVAFGPQCTHLGCAHRWDDRKRQFVCPCHNSLFSIEGEVLGGPAPRPLDRYHLKIEGNRLFLGELRRPPEDTA